MNAFLLNLFLALVWAAATGNFAESNIVFGFILGFLIIAITQNTITSGNYAQRGWRLFSFGLFFIWEMFKANVRVAHDVIRPSKYMRPGIIALPLTAKTDTEITMLATMITLTPGSVALDVSNDREVLYVHGMWVEDPEDYRHELKAGLERRILEVLR